MRLNRLAVIIICSAVSLLLMGGLIWLLTADVPVRPQNVSKTIANERFFNAD